MGNLFVFIPEWKTMSYGHDQRYKAMPKNKFEARSTKFETNPNSKCSNDQNKGMIFGKPVFSDRKRTINKKQIRFLRVSNFEFVSFEFVSSFDIRISDLCLILDNPTPLIGAKQGHVLWAWMLYL